MTAMNSLDWYFDFVSGFAYLQFESLDRIPKQVQIRYHPVLLAGLLGHHGQKGPAEIPEKRRFTYRYWVWRAARMKVPFRMPPAHPFNPLPALRLAIVLGCDAAAIRAIFRFIWRDGQSLDDPAAWRRLTEALGVADAEARINDPRVKAELRRATNEAAARGVFGVPASVVGEEMFWGLDATDMVVDYLRDAEPFGLGEMARVGTLPVGASRRL